jgi:hypothetical protein
MTTLEKLGKFILTDPLPLPFIYDGLVVSSLKAKNGETYCNFAVWYVAKEMGLTLPFQMANDHIDYFEASLEEVMAQEAQDHAKAGRLGIAGKKYSGHGHIAIIAPSPTGDLYHSGSWNREVPYVYNVGKTNGLLPVSRVCLVGSGEPSYFIWRG